MRFRKSLASLAAVALVSSAAVSVPALAQDADDSDDASLWVAGIGIAGAAILGIVLGTQHSNKEVHPVSP
jgi:hypothetical protein